MRTDLQAETIGLLRGEQIHIQPLGAVKLDRPLRQAVVEMEGLALTETGFFESLQVRGDALLGDIAVHPLPKRPGPCFLRRIFKTGLEGGWILFHSQKGSGCSA